MVERGEMENQPRTGKVLDVKGGASCSQKMGRDPGVLSGKEGKRIERKLYTYEISVEQAVGA